jgi:hypothetical protein
MPRAPPRSRCLHISNGQDADAMPPPQYAPCSLANSSPGSLLHGRTGQHLPLLPSRPYARNTLFPVTARPSLVESEQFQERSAVAPRDASRDYHTERAAQLVDHSALRSALASIRLPQENQSDLIARQRSCVSGDRRPGMTATRGFPGRLSTTGSEDIDDQYYRARHAVCGERGLVIANTQLVGV